MSHRLSQARSWQGLTSAALRRFHGPMRERTRWICLYGLAAAIVVVFASLWGLAGGLVLLLLVIAANIAFGLITGHWPINLNKDENDPAWKHHPLNMLGEAANKRPPEEDQFWEDIKHGQRPWERKD